MPDSSATTSKVASPPKGVSRVDEGKIKKPKASYKSEIPAIQHINGKTYACESCKRGHRVHKCDHGKTRPISETHQPGRPSAGQKRGCHCPRNCACTTKSCKCERNCACTQEMFLIVRLDNPAVVTRESTSTPKPVWEDADGNPLTLKKVWADANGKEIDNEEYEARNRLRKEREDAAKDAPTSSCCGSKKAKDEPDSPKGGCRHRQNVAAIQPHPGLSTPDPTPQSSAAEPWLSTCSCGSGCSCLYCPDHPNNATSINHAQQQVTKTLTDQGYMGNHALTPMPSHSETTSRSCMGGQPSFFLSNTPSVSQQQLQQFFSDTMNPNAIYLSYPVQHHSWSRSPLSSHCSPTPVMTMSPQNPSILAESQSEVSTPLPLSNHVNGVWDFSGNQLGDRSFSWLGLDASYGTDYNIGQATVASISNNGPFPILQPTTSQQIAALHPSVDAMQPLLNEFPVDPLPPMDNDIFVDFNEPQPLENLQANRYQPVPSFNVQPAEDNFLPTWTGFDFGNDHNVNSEFHMAGISESNSPILNSV